MAMRVVADEVKQIMDECTRTDQVIDAFIVAANGLVTSVFLNDAVISDALLKEIEKYLTAHLLASTLERTTIEEEVGDARVKFAGKFGEGLKATPYGHIVLTLDITGKMGKLGKALASIKAITTTDE